jgi:competence protein ComEA
MFKKIVKNYFTFSKKERIAAFVLMAVILFFIALPFIFTTKNNKPFALNKATLDSILSDTLQNNNNDNFKSNTTFSSSNFNNKYTLTPFVFNPNNLSEDGWRKIGLPEKNIKTILNYTSKGGKFYKPEDIKKIWGLRPADAETLIPFIVIDNQQKPVYNNLYKKEYNNPKKAEAIASTVDINTATLEQMRALPNIGFAAYKIVKYREKLGGFLNINQLKEANGINDSVFDALKNSCTISAINFNKININLATELELMKHPYISKDIAKAIVIYRIQHGNYVSVDGIKKIVFINQATFLKMAPYLSVENQ